MTPNHQDFADSADAYNVENSDQFYHSSQYIPVEWNAQAMPESFAHQPDFEVTLELQETQDSFYVLFELPGLERQDIHVQITHQTLGVQGYRKPRFHIPARAVLESEFYYGTFQRIIPIPEPIKKESSFAEYSHGILVIHLTKAAPRRSNKLDLKP